ncbi:ABC transporter ATP-binding protein [Microbacterium laevaniformans]|uniref:ABC transporter ATP-binding protein n=1 Tax=Microbacterium laevaniformans TaxID=36807 RepID=UPI00195B595B|nr:ABC transporter ATP-binding protein [Microbacterium laevaniformans]MBM7753508.1 ABC-type multidrug transport system ATPase subunit [Microbacterium laevaniformans]GLJ65624.1 multidrug ABC transporter ATP-binding protein [Microbacterium laevaniformans]
MTSLAVDPAVTVRGLRVRRGRTAVFDGLDLDIAAGRITGLLGPSGGGKTTLMRAIVGVQRIAGGTVAVLGMPAGSRGLRRRVAYDSQGGAVYDDLTVRQNLAYFAAARAVPATEVARVVDAVGLAPQEHRLVGSLSGGQRGRVSLGIALLGEPDLLVLDEPTVGLDPLLREGLWDLFRALADAGRTLIVSSHVMDEALRCDELVLVREGRVLAQTTPAHFLADAGASDPDAAFLRLVRSASGVRG